MPSKQKGRLAEYRPLNVDLAGRVALVTGANRGMGNPRRRAETARL
jgi:hypothetical protein